MSEVTVRILARCKPVKASDHVLTQCLVWTGPTSKGYGRVWVNGKYISIQRAIYADYFGPIPDGLYIDHICRVRGCARLTHLEAVTNAENVLRGEGIAAANARKTHCSKGHEFTEENTRIEHLEGRAPRRVCRQCKREAPSRNRARDERRRAVAAVLPVQEKPDR